MDKIYLVSVLWNDVCGWDGVGYGEEGIFWKCVCFVVCMI